MRLRSAAAALALIACVVVAPLLGVAVAEAGRPIIPPATALPENVAVQPPPAPPAESIDLSGQFQPLPLVEIGLSESPRPFAAHYLTAPALDAAARTKAIELALDEFQVPSPRPPAFVALLTALLTDVTSEGTPPDGSGDGGGVDTPSFFDTVAFDTIAGQARPAVVASPANATALNDLAVAAFASSLPQSGQGTDADVRVPGVPLPLASGGQLATAAAAMLELGADWFPADRALTVNRAWLTSLYPAGEGNPAPRIAALRDYVALAPRDVTARSLLAYLEVAADPEHGLDAALAVAQPLIDDPATEAAGRLIAGDARIRSAERRGAESPFLTRSILLEGRDDYDRAIELTGDPAAYAGRAAALDLLGKRNEAAAAMRGAVDLGAPSLVRRLHLAELDSCVDGQAGWVDDSRAAFDLAIAARVPTIPGLAFAREDDSERGYGGYSVGSDAVTKAATIGLPPTGGVVVATLEPFPQPITCMTRGLAADGTIETTATEAWLAAIAAGEHATARSVLAAWDATLSTDAQPPDEGGDTGGMAPSEGAAAIMDVLDGKTVDAAAAVDLSGLAVSRLPDAVETRVCSALLAAVGPAADIAPDLFSCLAEAAHRRGDDAAAATTLEPVVRADDPSGSGDAVVLQSGLLNELIGRLDVARDRYLEAASRTNTSIAGLQRLGDLDLRDNDGRSAIVHYDLALATIRTQSVTDPDTYIDETHARAVRQYIENNRGIALLMTAQPEPDAPPDCARFPAMCLDAKAMFDAAAAADPMNPVYPMNQAWVARLTGDEATADAKLTDALELGTPLVAPAWNDLGVLAARRGELDDAASHFREAIAAEPGYDLATWNLGLVESRAGGANLVAGQALLADATRVNPDLLNQELAYRTDERVYRVEVSGTKLEVARAPGTGAAVGAAAFGLIATIGAVGQLVGGLGGGDTLQGAMETLAAEGVARSRVRGFGSRFGFGGRRRRAAQGDAVERGARGWPAWLAWIPAIVVLVVSVTWTASWMAPDAILTATLIGLVATALALAVHACGHLVVADRLGASMRPSGWVPGLALGIVGMPFHVPAGPFLAESIETGDARRDWWVSLAGVMANLAAAGFAFLLYLAVPMPFLRILIATQLAVGAFSLIPSHPLDGDRLSSQPILLALLGLAVAAASTAIAVGAI